MDATIIVAPIAGPDIALNAFDLVLLLIEHLPFE